MSKTVHYESFIDVTKFPLRQRECPLFTVYCHVFWQEIGHKGRSQHMDPPGTQTLLPSQAVGRIWNQSSICTKPWKKRMRRKSQVNKQMDGLWVKRVSKYSIYYVISCEYFVLAGGSKVLALARLYSRVVEYFCCIYVTNSELPCVEVYSKTTVSEHV